MREAGLECYFTIDAGPNVKVITTPKTEKEIEKQLKSLDVVKEIYPCRVGPGISYID